MSGSYDDGLTQIIPIRFLGEIFLFYRHSTFLSTPTPDPVVTLLQTSGTVLKIFEKTGACRCTRLPLSAKQRRRMNVKYDSNTTKQLSLLLCIVVHHRG